MPVSKRFKVVSVKENGGGLCKHFLQRGGRKPSKKPFVSQPAEEIREVYRQFLVHNGLQGRVLSKDQKRDVVQYFYEHGHFNKRGIVTEISDMLKITRATVYRYLKHSDPS